MSRYRRFLRALGPALLLSVGGAYALASWDWCGTWGVGEATVLASGAAEGPLWAGAARARIEPPFPVVVAGYPPPRPDARSAESPLSARALVLRAGGMRVGLVSVDLLTLPAPLEAAVRGAVADLGLSELWVVATHAHSSLGGYEAGLVSQLAGTGGYREDARAAVVSAAARALREAAGALTPVALELGGGELGALVSSRSDDPRVDSRVTRARFRAGDRTIAELLILAAHPTLWPRRTGVLSPDYPGHLAAAREAEGGVTLVLQGGVGNASADLGERQVSAEGRAGAFAAELARAAAAVKLEPSPTARLAFARSRVPLPRPDASRLVPALFRAAGDNFLCQSAPREVELSALAVGPLRLLSVPGEATAAAGQVLEAAASARVVSVANGYLGYVETPEHTRARSGESLRQYFGPQLLDALRKAAEAAAHRL